MKLIIISGAEATGKSEIGKHVARGLNCIYYAKDVVKEHLFDTESISTWKYSWYERKAKEEYFNGLAGYLENDKDLVLESNFIGNDKKHLEKLLNGKTMTIVEVHCYARGLTSFKRFVMRNESKMRHPGHHDRRWYLPVLWNAIMSDLKIHDAHAPMQLSNKIMYVDTTQFEAVDKDEIVRFVSAS